MTIEAQHRLEAERQLVAEHSPDCTSHPGEIAPIVFDYQHPWPDGPNLMSVVCCDGALDRLKEHRAEVAR